MRRISPGLAILAGLLIAAGAGPHASAARRIAAGSAWIAQGAVLAILAGSGRKVARIARDRRLPGWVVAQSDRNYERMRILSYAGMTMAGAAATGAAGPGLAGLAAGFELGALLVGGAAIAVQLRLLRAAEGRPGGPRAVA